MIIDWFSPRYVLGIVLDWNGNYSPVPISGWNIWISRQRSSIMIGLENRVLEQSRSIVILKQQICYGQRYICNRYINGYLDIIQTLEEFFAGLEVFKIKVENSIASGLLFGIMPRCQVWMLQSLFYCQPFPGIKGQHLLEEVNGYTYRK